MPVEERVHSFGEDGALVGIATLPSGDDGRPRAERPFVVLLNAGLVHRVGPFGLGVQLARKLAGEGYRVLRFDQSGIGDSPASPSAMPVAERAVLDGRAALDFVAERYGAERFIVAGLCTGAVNSHRLALVDPRIAGACLLDGYAYPTFTYQKARVRRRLEHPTTWAPLVRRVAATVASRVRRRLGRDGRSSTMGESTSADPTDERESIFYQAWPDRALVRTELERILDRGVRLLFVYTGGWSTFVAPAQFDEMFPRLRGREHVTVSYHAEADHTFYALADRERLFADFSRFVGAI
jgi:pimeloyl-ACP methyl ester carboxylesterase